MKSFARKMRDHQLRWALANCIPVTALEERKGKPSWVLKPECRTLNLFQREWWTYIAGSEHRWARALNSSQCFGVNLFAPLADDKARARVVLTALFPDRQIRTEDLVVVHFEHTPVGAKKWMGERGQATQVDVLFEVVRAARPVGFVLVEVKFTETGFGSCRGWKAKADGTSANPDRNRCLNAREIAASSQAQCWLAEVEGRRYWEGMSYPSSSIRLELVGLAGACPFRHGLYQLMRNRVLADELSRRMSGAWAEFAVCSHPDNEALNKLKQPVSGSNDTTAAFRSLSSENAVRTWSADQLLNLISSTDARLASWQSWMHSRYFP